jgi:hypothetical protein
METARKRDEARAEIKSIDKERNGRVTPTNANPMAVTVQSMLATFGVEPRAEALEGIRHWRTFTKTFAIEAAAMIMPGIWIEIFERLISAITAAKRLKTTTAVRLANLSKKRGRPNYLS